MEMSIIQFSAWPLAMIYGCTKPMHYLDIIVHTVPYSVGEEIVGLLQRRSRYKYLSTRHVSNKNMYIQLLT